MSLKIVKIELEQDDIQAIAREVVEMLKPLLSHSQDSLLDVPRLTKYLGVKDKWIYDKARENAIPFVKVGKYLRFRKSEIDAWLRENNNHTR